MTDDRVPAEAVRLHEAGRAAASNGDLVRGLELLNTARELAPDWPYPPYDMAFTYLLGDYLDEAERWYAHVDALAPRGFFTAKATLHTIRREQRGELPSGFTKAYALLEFQPPEVRARALEQITAKFPSFAPAWKDYALQLDDTDARLAALDRGLAADPDDETRGVLTINRAIVLRNRGDTEEAQRIVAELLRDPRCTQGAEAVAKGFGLVDTRPRNPQ